MGVLCQSCDLRLFFRSQSGFGCVERVRTLFSSSQIVIFNTSPFAPAGQRCYRMGNPLDLFCQPDYSGLLFCVKSGVRCAEWVRVNLCSGFDLPCATCVCREVAAVRVCAVPEIFLICDTQIQEKKKMTTHFLQRSELQLV